MRPTPRPKSANCFRRSLYPPCVAGGGGSLAEHARRRGWCDVADGRGHARVVRHAHASRAAHHDGYGIGVAACGDECGFLIGVDLLSGQRRRHFSYANHGRTAAAHPERRGDVGQQHRKHAQHRIDPAIERRWGYQPSVREFVSCHRRDYTRVQRPVDSGERYPTNLHASGLSLQAKISGRPTNPGRLRPPICAAAWLDFGGASFGEAGGAGFGEAGAAMVAAFE